MDIQSRIAFILVPLALTLGGCILLVMGIISIRRERAFEREAVGAQGIVVGFQRRSGTIGRYGTSSRYLDHPVVRYSTHAGQEILFESPDGTSPRIHHEGQQVQVLYNPANPADARLNSGCLRFGLPIAFIILGLGILLFSSCFGLLAISLISQVPAA